MDYYLGDERERFEEVFSDEIRIMAKPVIWVLYFLLVLIVGSMFAGTFASETFFGLFWKENCFWGFVAAYGLLGYFIFRKNFKEEKLFEEWKEGNFPLRPYDYRDYRPRS